MSQDVPRTVCRSCPQARYLRCMVNGVERKDVVYADTERGFVVVLVKGGIMDFPAIVSGDVRLTRDTPEPRQFSSEEFVKASRSGYEPVSCEECGELTVVRNGKFLKCSTCGATSYHS